MPREKSPYRCEKHGPFYPDFEREVDGEVCPRIMCLECEKASMDPDSSKHPKNIKYFYNDEMKVILQEGHWRSAVWKFDPPVVVPEFTFAQDLNPIIPKGALTSEQIMERMEAVRDSVEKAAAEVSSGKPSDMLLGMQNAESIVEKAKDMLKNKLN